MWDFMGPCGVTGLKYCLQKAKMWKTEVYNGADIQVNKMPTARETGGGRGIALIHYVDL